MNKDTLDKIRKAKNLNRSARDRLKNLNIRSEIISKIILDRSGRWGKRVTGMKEYPRRFDQVYVVGGGV